MKYNIILIINLLFLFAVDSNAGINQQHVYSEADTLSTQSNQNLIQKKWEQGIDFYALGNEPSWSLDMDKEKHFHFNTMSGIDIYVPVVEGVRAMDADLVRFRSVSETAELIIQLSHISCTDNMSGEKFHYKVTVDYKTPDMKDYETYKGCGNDVPDMRLHDIWAIVQLGDQTLKPENFGKGLPTVELNVTKETVSGHNGCNRFRGSFEAGSNFIIFSQLAGTRMACPNMQISDRITAAISGKNLHFTLDNGKLILSKDNKTVMILKHID
jgi:uncharacterized membrane protein